MEAENPAAYIYAGYIKPIHLFATKSFWMALSGLVILLGAGEPVFRVFVVALAPLLGWDLVQVEEVVTYLITITPAVLWLASLHQRSGVSRPYTLNPVAAWY